MIVKLFCALARGLAVLGGLMKKWFVRINTIKALGGLFFLLGITCSVTALYFEEIYTAPSHGLKIFFEFILHFGMALMILGILEFVISLEDLKAYFQERLADTVMERSYLAKMGKGELVDLQTATLKAYFDDKAMDREGSFLKHFFTRIHDFIGSPFRENYISEMHITREGADFFLDERISFKCRKAGESIQRNVKWTSVTGEFVGDVEYTVKIKCPPEFGKMCDRNCLHKNVCGKEIPISADHVTRKDGEPCSEINVNLDEFRHVDNLSININVKAQIHHGRFIASGVNHPTKNGQFIFHFPPDLDIIVDYFGIHFDDMNISKFDGYFSCAVDQWMLPLSGIVAQLIPKKVKEDNSSTTHPRPNSK